LLTEKNAIYDLPRYSKPLALEVEIPPCYSNNFLPLARMPISFLVFSTNPSISAGVIEGGAGGY